MLLSLRKRARKIRQWIIDTPFQPAGMLPRSRTTASADDENASFAVRSSATAEDMPDASFAGQQETFLERSGFYLAFRGSGNMYLLLCLTIAPSLIVCTRVTITVAWRFLPPVFSGWCAPTSHLLA
ncbi:PEP/pyruvate-binding domain-containing protein [Escherichia coli]